MSFTNTLAAMRFLKMLVTPFDQLPAFDLGIIDSEGNLLKKKKERKSKKERDAYTEVGNIVCKFQANNSIYVDFTNRVWPCCYLPNAKWLVGDQKFYDDYFYDKSNNLLEKSLEEIMNDPFWDILQMSWDVKSACLPACSSTCSFNENKIAAGFRVNVFDYE